MDLFKPIELNYKEKCRNLDVEAKGEVKSTKYFPVFLIDGEEYIFKPLSKTKPLTTPLFAYSEVFWSYMINKYFDSRTPIYKLAYCKGVSDDQPKYYDKGVLVKSVLKQNQKLTNIYEYFEKHPEDTVDISTYVNYCMKKYDYTKILTSNFCKNNEKFGEALAFQVLLSILRQDQNFHYENVNYIEENNAIIEIAPPLDFEFSTMFLYPDSCSNNESYKNDYLKVPEPFDFKDCITDIEVKGFFVPEMYDVCQNIITIVKNYPEMVNDFISKLDIFSLEMNIEFEDSTNFIDFFNSDYWLIGDARYKRNDENSARYYESTLESITIEKDELFKKIKTDVLDNAQKLSYILKVYLYCSKEIDDLKNTPFSKLEEFYNNKGMGVSLKKIY